MRKAFIQLHIAVFLAVSPDHLGRLIHLNEFWLVWYRLLITSATMWIVFAIGKKLRKIPAKDMLKLTGLGFIAAMHWVNFFTDLSKAQIYLSRLVCFSSVGFFTALLEPLILKVKIKWTEVLLGSAGDRGIYIIFHFDAQYKTGIILGTISALLLAFVDRYFPAVCSKKQSRNCLDIPVIPVDSLALSILMPFIDQQFPAAYILPTWNDWKVVACLVLALLLYSAFQFTGHALKKLSAFTVNLTFKPGASVWNSSCFYHIS
jgi:hypothetical protein